MRYARHFNPEWGYVAPAPSVMRMDCLIVVAAIILAVAGAATGVFFAASAGRHLDCARGLAAVDSWHIGRGADWTTGGQIVLYTALGRVACRRFVGERGLGSLSSESEAIRFIDRRP